jgi:hypothetical protein
MFILEFDRKGLCGLTPPITNDPQELSRNYAFLRRVSVAVQDFDARIKEIETAYAEVVAGQ